ncbi:MAG: 4Fe-4S dicluster domain-containing protein [Selenomonas sp.]|uniref:4Fe-4S dicluster domain-containing protein n=1 Tax=Selenomonas sp. TaxID=2053611 RepID=UPI0025E83961|nr:4Fe-4S dicluster domain-containing protein [Selenomonas sp.]MCR5756698.1 4Fe-4S dicluster domain-containing protein [Selenomonas sp.]
MAKRYAFLIDTSLCIGCNACENACKNFYQQDAAVHWRKVYYMQEKDLPQPLRVGVSLACNHCDDPACMKACPAGAYYKDENGLVRHDNDKCIGCKLCTMACPYNVPCYDKKLGKVTKCEMCAERMAQGEEPVCVASCPMGAIRIIDLHDPKNAEYADHLPGLPPTNMTQPATRFILPKKQKQDWRAE